MTALHIFRTVCGLTSAICATAALLCASCATGAKEESDKKNPKEVSQLYMGMGTQALIRGDNPQAVEDLRKAITLDSENAIARNHLGLAYYGLGKKDLARAEILQAVTIDPNYSDAYVNLGNIAMDNGDNSSARKHYNRALENLEYRQRHRALTNLAQLALHENNTEEARRLLYQSLQANPDYCMSHFLLGSIFARENNPQRASEEFKKSIASTCTSNVEAHYQLGMSYLKARDFARARKTFVYIVETFPHAVRAQQAGDQLRNIP